MKRPYRLTTAFIRGLRAPGCYGDGRGGSGLQIRVHRTAGGDVSKSWRQKLKIGGKATTVGLGSWPFVTLADARKLAATNRLKVLAGVDPRTEAAIPDQPVAVPFESRTSPSFDAAAQETLAMHREGWKEGSSTEARWRRSLAGLPFGRKLISEVESADVLAVIQPKWTRTPAAAKAQLDIIRAVFKWSIGAGHRDTDPIVRVQAALPRQNGRRKHHKAVPVAEAPAAMAALRTVARSRLLTRLALQFQVLTATRGGEVAAARWNEIDGDVWVVPPSRMKSKREHRVPLSAAALAVLDAAARETGERSGLIFPAPKGGELHHTARGRCLKDCGIAATSHGFARSTFRDWCAETGVAREVAEACLAHVVGGVEGAYFRSDLLERRRDVSEAWARYLA
ncbi:MAG: integrase arm-type DNA-binding domain-containing protein [Gammaproteobacteria bacterium]|nr:integrase arm-type DNA-binding domain-containing protein [Gammaproteobacteria bacterium]